MYSIKNFLFLQFGSLVELCPCGVYVSMKLKLKISQVTLSIVPGTNLHLSHLLTRLPNPLTNTCCISHFIRQEKLRIILNSWTPSSWYISLFRYHFLVYNSSVIYWQFCRPFLKPTYRQYLSVSLHSVVKALDDIDDKDTEWRARLMIALIECHIDANHIKEAGEVSKVTSDFTRTNVPMLFKQVLALQVRGIRPKILERYNVSQN